MMSSDEQMSTEMKHKDEENGTDDSVEIGAVPEDAVEITNSKRLENILKHQEEDSPKEREKIKELLSHWEQGSPEEVERIGELLKCCEQVSEALNERFVRKSADFDNYKKRVEKEKNDISLYGNEKLIKELLEVLDNLQRAVDCFDSENNMESLFEGVKLVQNQLITTLQKFGLDPIDATEGTKFNPMHHQAIEQRSEGDESGLILDERAKGYMLKERLIRPSMVVVSDVEDVKKSKNKKSRKGKKNKKNKAEGV